MRTKFKIPDKPFNRPKVPGVLKLIRVYVKDGERYLHVFLDGNYEDYVLQSIIHQCRNCFDIAGLRIANKLLAMTQTQRRKIARSTYNT